MILLLHGSADTPQAWSAVAQRLGPSVAVVAPALPPIQTPLALDTDLPWLTEVMATTGARTLGGHSYGALLALRWALAHPGQLDRLVLAEPIAWGIGRGEPGLDGRLAELERECLGRFAAGDDRAALHWLVDYWNGPGFFERLPARVHANLVAGAARTWAEVASGGTDRTAAPELAALAVPTRLLAGADSTPDSVRVAHLLAAAIAGAQIDVLAGAGHQFLRSHAAEVAVALGTGWATRPSDISRVVARSRDIA